MIFGDCSVRVDRAEKTRVTKCCDSHRTRARHPFWKPWRKCDVCGVQKLWPAMLECKDCKFKCHWKCLAAYERARELPTAAGDCADASETTFAAVEQDQEKGSPDQQVAAGSETPETGDVGQELCVGPDEVISHCTTERPVVSSEVAGETTGPETEDLAALQSQDSTVVSPEDSTAVNPEESTVVNPEDSTAVNMEDSTAVNTDDSTVVQTEDLTAVHAVESSAGNAAESSAAQLTEESALSTENTAAVSTTDGSQQTVGGEDDDGGQLTIAAPEPPVVTVLYQNAMLDQDLKVHWSATVQTSANAEETTPPRPESLTMRVDLGDDQVVCLTVFASPAHQVRVPPGPAVVLESHSGAETDDRGEPFGRGRWRRVRTPFFAGAVLLLLLLLL